MPIIRRKLQPSDVYPDTIRYNPLTDEVEVLVDGDWIPAPDSDPRRQTTLPPRVTANPACDGARSVADALSNQIDQIATAIDNAQTAAQIAALILGLFSFGVFAIFINIALAIAGYMLDAGTAAIVAALPGSAYDDLTCILYCHMDGNGRLIEGTLPAVQDQITTEIGGIGAVILNQMLALAGEGGINNLAAAGTSTGSCGGCDCGCGAGCTPGTVTYEYDDAAWTVHGTYTRYSAGTPVGSFDSFTLGGTTAFLDLGVESCVTQVDVVVNNGCGPTGGADVELFVGGVSQGVQNVADKVGCGVASANWLITGGAMGDDISLAQIGSHCVGGYDNLLICVRVESCV